MLRYALPMNNWIAACSLVAAGCVDAAGDPDEPTPAAALDWDTPLGPEHGIEALDPELFGVTLQDILGGAVPSRNGQPCSACHFDTTVTLYRPYQEQYSAVAFSPRDVVDGRPWATSAGWGERYVSLGPDALIEKPRGLRDALQLWLETDAAQVLPLTWSTAPSRESLGVAPDPALLGALGQIVNSEVSGRPDDLLCSACHYTGGPYEYRPPVEQDAVSAIGPDEVVDGASWAGGWASAFLGHAPGEEYEKPAYLRAAWYKWLQDGAR